MKPSKWILVALAGLYLVVHVIAPSAMGAGDVTMLGQEILTALQTKANRSW